MRRLAFAMSRTAVRECNLVSGAQASANEPAVHGIAPAEIAQGPNFSEAWARFVAFAEGLIDLSLPDDSGDIHDSEDDDSPGPPRLTL